MHAASVCRVCATQHKPCVVDNTQQSLRAHQAALPDWLGPHPAMTDQLTGLAETDQDKLLVAVQ